MIIFETERLIVRQYTEEDKENVFRVAGNELVMQYIRPVSTREESGSSLLEYIAGYETNPHGGRWAAIEKKNGLFIGSFAIIPIPSQPEKIQLGYALLPEHWGKGYATELTKAGLDYFMKNLKLPEIYGVTEIPNIVSQKVLLKAGFQPSGSLIEAEKELLLFVAKRIPSAD